MSGHTRGPWRWARNDNLGSDDVGAICGPGESYICLFGDDTMYYPSAGEAPKPEDIQLILASPTMLAAIEQFETWWIEDGQSHFNGAPACVFALRDAARAARGES